MALKIDVTVTVSDSEKDSYKDPSGSVRAELFAVDESDLAAVLDGVAVALAKVASLRYKAELAGKEGD